MNDDLANAFEKASINAGALEQILVDDEDEDGAAQANEAENDLLIAAEQANAENAMGKLGATEPNRQRLQRAADAMDAATARIATQEKNVQKFVALAAAAGRLVSAASSVPPNVDEGIGALKDIEGTLNIR